MRILLCLHTRIFYWYIINNDHCVDRGLILDLLAQENFELMRRTQKWRQLSLHSNEKK